MSLPRGAVQFSVTVSVRCGDGLRSAVSSFQLEKLDFLLKLVRQALVGERGLCALA